MRMQINSHKSKLNFLILFFREDDAMLPKTLLECILTHQTCIVPNRVRCMAEFQRCSLGALEDSRKRRLLSASSGEIPVAGRDNMEGGPDINEVRPDMPRRPGEENKNVGFT